MRITFNTIEIHNFMSFQDEVFDYSSFKGMNLICGKNNDIPGAKNGTGKTTLFSALIFCLFGETQNKIKNEYMHNRYVGSKEMRVVTNFMIDDVKYKVASGFNKYGGAYCNIIRYEDEKELDLTKSSIIETRKFLEKEILHCDMSIFLRTIMLSSDQTYNFFKLRKYEKKEFIEKLFDIAVFGEMYNSIHRDTLNYDKEILTLQNKLMMLNKAKDEYVDCMNKHEEVKNSKIGRLTESLEKLQQEHSMLKNHTIATNTTEVQKYEDLSNKITDAIDKLTTAKFQVDKAKSKIDVQIHKLNASKEQKQKAIDKHSDILSKLCDDCAKVFKDYYSIGTYVDEIADIDKKLETERAQMEQNDTKSKDFQLKIDQLKQKLCKVEKKLTDLTQEYVKANNAIAVCESRIDTLNADLENTRNDVNPYVKLFQNNKKEFEENTTEFNNISEKYKYLKFAETIVSQDTLRKFIIKDLIGLLNNKIKMYLTRLGSKYTVEFDSDMNYEFITDGGACEYDNFSAGERQRIMIATCFAFRDFMAIRNNLSSNILILDEFIDGNVDSLAIEGIISILRDFIIMYNQNIYVVSHRKEVDNSIFNNIIQVQKTNNISKVVVLDV